MLTDDLSVWIKRLTVWKASDREQAAADAVAAGLLAYLPDLVELFARGRADGAVLVTLMQAVPAGERRALLREAGAHEKLPSLLQHPNSLIVVLATKLLAEAGDLSVVPALLAVRVYAAAGYAAQAIKAIVRAAGEPGLQLAGELARSSDRFTRAIGLDLLEAATAADQGARLAAGDTALAAVVAELQADERPLVREAAAVVMAALDRPGRGPALVELALRHGDVLVRRGALRALIRLGPPEAWLCCVSALEDSDQHVADMAAEALHAGEAAVVLDAVARTLLEEGPAPRLAAVVAALAAPESVDLLALLLQDADAQRVPGEGYQPEVTERRVRRMAQRAVRFDGPLGGPAREALWQRAASQGWSWPRIVNDVFLLLRGLEDPEAAAREAARRLLFRELRPVSPAAVALAMEFMARLPAGEELLVQAVVELEEEVRPQARRALAGRLGLAPDVAADRLVRGAAWVAAMQDGAPERRAFAARVLGRFGCREAAPALERALMDPDPGVAAAAADALAELGPPDVEGALIGALRQRPGAPAAWGPEDTAQQRMTAALARWGGMPALRFLLARGRGGEADASAVAVLGRRLGAGAYDMLLEQLGRDDDAARPLALIAMGATGDERSVDVLGAWLPPGRFTAAAVRGLGESRQPSAVGPLLDVYDAFERHEGHDAVSAHQGAQGALEAILRTAAGAVEDVLLERLARLEPVLIGVWAGDVKHQDEVGYDDVRLLAGEELERRGRPRPEPEPQRRLFSLAKETLDQVTEPLEEPPFLHLPHLLRSCPCGEAPSPSGPGEKGWVTARCTRGGHSFRYREAYIFLVRTS